MQRSRAETSSSRDRPLSYDRKSQLDDIMRHRKSHQAPPPTNFQHPGSPPKQACNYNNNRSQRGSTSSQDHAPDPTDSLQQQYQRQQQQQMPPPQQPVRDAVNTAFRETDTTHQLPSDLVAQITEQVLRNLQASGMAGQQAPQPTPPVVTSHPSAIPPRNVYTPPSPNRSEKSFDYRDSQIDGTIGEGSSGGDRRYSERPRTPSAPFQMDDEPATRRPSPPARQLTDDTTTLEKIWQPLFDSRGQPTARLGMFLRGLAIHIIEDYEPKKSLVISPQKMLRFYTEADITPEIYPWTQIFGGKLKAGDLSHLYRDLQCQHHFVQQFQHDEKPCIPSLTPLGFERWMTIMIQAHPDQEFERFQKAVLNMPISNADDSKERFPKQLSRRLFPKHADENSQMDVEDAITADDIIQLPRRPPPAGGKSRSSSAYAASAPPQASQMPSPPREQYGYSQQYAERGAERQQATRSSMSATSDPALDDEASIPISIERERKPYYAQPGQGKQYDDELRKTQSESLHPPGTQDYDDAIPRTTSRRRAESQATGGYPAMSRQRSQSSGSNIHSYSKSEADVPASTYRTDPTPRFVSPEEDEMEAARHVRNRGSHRSSMYADEEETTTPTPKTYIPPRTMNAAQGQAGGYEEDYINSRRMSGESGRSSGANYNYPPPPRSQY